jgi:uncharacterized protein with HEPN domain
MRDYAQKAVDMVAGQIRGDLDNDEKLRFAVTHLVELVGEAANQIPDEIQAQYSEVPWQKITSMRHRLIHGYDSVDHSILWDTITSNLPDLIEMLNRILGEKHACED